MAGTAHRNEFGDYAALTAYADAQWAEPGAGLPSDEHWPRSDVVPQIGSHRLLSLLLPEDVNLSTPFWVLFEPGLASLNGWDSHPDQIDRSAFVQCRLLKTARSDDETRWLDIAIEDVAPLPLLTQRFPPRRVDQLGIWELGKAALTRQDAWHYLSAIGDDAGCWLLARADQGSDMHIVACSEWVYGHRSLHQSAWGGHIVVTALEWKRICDRL